jgi:ABC-2 type transport system ATP-binding protein
VALPLAIRGLVRRYGRFLAVDGLELEVRPGEILGFLGPNGAGKTTTLRCCAGLLRPDRGEILVAGHSLAGNPRAARSAMGFVPDRPYLYERLSAREMLDLIGALYDVPPAVARRRADELIERLALAGAADDLIESYSQGMRQKVAVAAAVLHDPPLLMLDEPLIGLDPLAARELKDLLRERADAGYGVLVSTHLLDVAERLCDRVTILHHGRRLAEGSLAALRGESEATLEDVFLALTRDAEPAQPPSAAS